MNNIGLGVEKKIKRKVKNQKKEVVINKEQTKFFVDLSHEEESLSLIFDFLLKCNDKSYGSPVLFRDLCVYAISKLNNKDVEKLKEGSLSEMEKIYKTLDEHNKKNGTSLEIGEYLVKKLGIN